ncbi:MAG: hypothetical protein WC820_11160 [Spirochaetales bacterium]|jgi:predicted ferric reductase
MNKTTFYLAYFLSPLIPIIIYFVTLGIPIDLYAFSVVLGITAFIFICNQFILASRPVWAAKALGLKQLTRLHSTMPIVIVALAVIHESIKQIAGLNTESLQADFGAVSLTIFVAVIVFTVLFMVTTFWMKIDTLKKIRAWVYARTGLDYKKARFLHNATIVAVPLLLTHVLLASSSRLGTNPVGALVLAGWMVVSLGLYIRYRINGRVIKAE